MTKTEDSNLYTPEAATAMDGPFCARCWHLMRSHTADACRICECEHPWRAILRENMLQIEGEWVDREDEYTDLIAKLKAAEPNACESASDASVATSSVDNPSVLDIKEIGHA